MPFRHLLAPWALIALTLLASIARAAPGGPPVEEFADSYWVYCEYDCKTTVYHYRIHLREDGMMGYQRTAEDEMIYDGTDRWKLVGPYLVLSWTDGYAVEVFEVGTGGQDAYVGVHSGVDEPSAIERAPEAGATEDGGGWLQ